MAKVINIDVFLLKQAEYCCFNFKNHFFNMNSDQNQNIQMVENSNSSLRAES